LALGNHGILRFQISRSTWATSAPSRSGSARSRAPVPRPDVAKDNYAHVGTLSNLKQDGKYVGLPDAGQDWHTDMSYRDVMGFVNVLYGIRIPRRNGVPLGGTEFSNMHAVYDAAARRHQDPACRRHHDAQLREILGAHAPRQGERAPPMSDLQRKQRPPVVHPLFLTHPITAASASTAIPATQCASTNCLSVRATRCWSNLFDFQLEQRFRYTHTWNENDLLVWDHLGTIHRAIADYGRTKSG